MKNNNKGFSLVELIVVIAIMAVLVGVLAPSLLRYVEKSRFQKDCSAVAELEEAIKIALADETIYDSLTADTDYTISLTKSDSTVPSVDGLTDFNTEIQKTIPSVKLSSKTIDAIVTVTFSVDSAGTVTVENNLDDFS